MQRVSCARDFCEIVDSGDLKIIFPDYSKVDLVCGSMPSKNDSLVIFVAAAAYTGECLDSFRHKGVRRLQLLNEFCISYIQRLAFNI